MRERQAFSEDQHQHLLTHGFVVLPGFLQGTALRAARRGMLKYFPTDAELRATPHRYAAILEEAEYQQVEFPYDDDALNHVATHPQIIRLVEQLLGDSQVMLSQSAIWAKYAGIGSFEQPMHTDFEGNTLVYPRDDGPYRQVNLILYYTDVDETLGPTCVVSQTKTRGQSLWPPFRPRVSYPSLYRAEKPLLVTAGSLLVFSMSTLHRASEMVAERGVRFTHHLVYRSARFAFSGYHQWSRFGEKPELRRFLENASPRQREVIGFPAAGDPYWNEQTLSGVARRYPKMDLTPYRALRKAGPRPRK